MNSNDRYTFRHFSYDRLTEILVELFRYMDSVHQYDKRAFGHFDIKDISVEDGDRLMICGVGFG